MTPKQLSTAEFVALMASLMALNAFAIDIMLPALPQMGEALAVADENHRQYVVIAYVIGLGLVQPFYGPISDSYGRKGPLMVSLVGYTLFGLACVVAPTFPLLVAARAMQGVFAAGTRVITLSIVRDVHSGRAMAKMMSLVMMTFMAVPILAPNIGQWVLWALNWRWVFGVLAIVGGSLVLWVSARYHETLAPESRTPLNVASLKRSYGEVFRTRTTVGYMLATGVIFGALFAFISCAQQVYGDVFDKADTFTLYFAAVAGGMGVAAFINSRIVQRVGMRRLSHSALCVFALNNVLYAAALLAGWGSFPLFFGSLFLSFFCFSFIGANSNALAMEPVGHIAGTASAALGFTSTMLAGILGALIGQQFDGTVVPLATGFATLGVVALIVVTIVERGRLFGAADLEESASQSAAAS